MVDPNSADTGMSIVLRGRPLFRRGGMFRDMRWKVAGWCDVTNCGCGSEEYGTRQDCCGMACGTYTKSVQYSVYFSYVTEVTADTD